jgi:replicative DNA helicase
MRPSNTAFSLNIAENVALDTNLPVAVFSMEMAATQLVMRMLGSVGRLDQHKLRTGKIVEDDWHKLTMRWVGSTKRRCSSTNRPASPPWKCAPGRAAWRGSRRMAGSG